MDYRVLFILDKDGNGKAHLSSGNTEWLPTRQIMESIKDYAECFLVEYKDNEAIDQKNKEMQQIAIIEYKKQQDKFEQARIIKKSKEIKATYVYVINDVYRGFYKIGQTSNIKSRIKTLKHANPGIKLISYYSCSPDKEKQMHDLFTDKNVGGEWFALNDNDINLIDSLLK